MHTTLVLKINLIVAPWAHHSHDKEKTCLSEVNRKQFQQQTSKPPGISVKDLFAASLLTSGHPSPYQELPAASLPPSLPASVPACLVWWCHCLCFVPDSAPPPPPPSCCSLPPGRSYPSGAVTDKQAAWLCEWREQSPVHSQLAGACSRCLVSHIQQQVLCVSLLLCTRLDLVG